MLPAWMALPTTHAPRAIFWTLLGGTRALIPKRGLTLADRHLPVYLGIDARSGHSNHLIFLRRMGP
jgi:hypothetical protein